VSLRLIEGTGELTEHGCAECARLQAKVNGLEQDLLAVERELRSKRATIKAMRTDRDKARQAYANREDVERLFAYWQERCNHPNSKLDGERFDRLRWGLEHYGMAACELAIDGAGLAPFVKDGKKFDAISLIFRSADKFEDFANRGARARKRPGR
jgi:hypothetical protein